jgi:hypothetical protein
MSTTRDRSDRMLDRTASADWSISTGSGPDPFPVRVAADSE